MDNENLLNRLHIVEIEILKEIDSFCKRNNIKYSLYCGTLLGAVRHKGFIPWDDDIDLCMERGDYNRFIKLWQESENRDLILQNKETNRDFSQSFTKIKKNNTTFLQKSDKGKSYHKGIFVDILPIDRIPNGKLNRLFFKFYVMMYLLFTREFVPPKSSGFVVNICRVLLKLFRGNVRIAIRKLFLIQITKFEKNKDLQLVSANSMDGFNHIMPADMPNQMKEYSFENRIFMGYSDFDGMLKAWYKDYMQLPPIDDRVWKHRPLVVDFEKNYEDIK